MGRWEAGGTEGSAQRFGRGVDLRFALSGAALLAIVAGLHVLVPSLTAAAPALALFNRLARSSTFDNDTRRKIFDDVRVMPGSSISDIAERVGVSHSTASYHLDKLVGFKLLTSTADGNKMRYFVDGGVFTDEERRTLAALNNAETRRVLSAISRNNMTYRAELTNLLGVSPPTVSWHLERLVGAGLIAEQRAGRHRQLFTDRRRLEKHLRSILSKVADTSYDTQGLRDLLQDITVA
jgi:predicted transcriptional regulator